MCPVSIGLVTDQTNTPEEPPQSAANTPETPYVPPALAPWPPAADEQPTWAAPPPAPPVAPPGGSPPAGAWQQLPPSAPPSGPAAPLPPSPAPYPGGGYPSPYPPAGSAGYGYPPVKSTDSKAIVAIIMALGSFVVCPGVMAVIAIVLAVQSDRAIAASNGQLEGHSMNVASKWIAGANLVLMALAIVAAIIFGVWAATHPEVLESWPSPEATAF